MTEEEPREIELLPWITAFEIEGYERVPPSLRRQ